MPKRRPRARKRTRVSRRNPVAPAARALHPRVKPSGKVYKRKPKRQETTSDDGAEP
ncbi:MAG TPA: hypothetical protein VIK47_09255 [Kiloniellales bacterium]